MRTRRPSRLKTEPPDRQPVLVAGAALVGLVVALVGVPRLMGGTDPRVESYVVLASQLHQQGESPFVLRDRLLSVGIAQPAPTVLQLAQKYAGSRDKKQQHQAEALENFGKILLNPPPPATPSPTAVPATPTPAAPPQATLTPFVLGGAAPSLAQATPRPGTGTPPAGAATSAPGTVPAAASPSPAAAAPASTTVQRGRIKPPDGGAARLRKDPSLTSVVVSLIPNAAQVEVLETVQGQPIEGDSRWLRVRYGNMTGYLWSKLVVVGE